MIPEWVGYSSIMTISARNNNIIVWFAKENYLEVPYCIYVKAITDIYSVIIF
jgi:hypothetical protein